MVTIKQFLGKKIYEGSYLHIDFWSIVHLIGFFLLGIYFPNKLGLIIIGTGIKIAITAFLFNNFTTSTLGVIAVGLGLGIVAIGTAGYNTLIGGR